MYKQLKFRLHNRFQQIRNGRPNHKIFFMHIAKCGGSSITNAVRDSFAPLNPLEDHVVFHLDPYAAHQAAIMSQQDPLDYNRKLLRYCLGCHEYDYVYGHFSFDEVAFEEYQDQFAFVTILRNPIDKWFSLYFYNRYKASDFFKIEESLEEFVYTPTAIGYGCDYVMQFAGNYACDHYSYDDYTTKPAIAHAIGNMKKFHLVGCLEQLDQFVEQFQQLYGSRLQIATKNKNPLSKRDQQQLVSDEIMEKVRELCQPNFAIYDQIVTNCAPH